MNLPALTRQLRVLYASVALVAILLFGVLVTIGLVSQSTSDTKTDSSKAAEGATGLGAKSIKLAPATQSKPPTVDVEKKELQPAAGEKFDPSEILQALSELQALGKGGGSTQQIQEKKAALKAAIESGMKKDPKSVISLVLGFTENSDGTLSIGRSHEVSLFVKSDPELAIALLDQVPRVGLDMVVENIGSAWAESDPKAAIAWANQQTDPEIKEWILDGVIPFMAKTDLQGAFAYVQSLPPGDSQDRLISQAFSMAANHDNLQGALAMMQSLPEGRTKDSALMGISRGMSYTDLQAAMDMASGIGDTGMRTQREQEIVAKWSRKDPDAAIQWVQSLPVGQAKDLAAQGISQGMSLKDPQTAMAMASGIGDTGIRNQAEQYVVAVWSTEDPDAAIQWMQSLPLGQAKDSALMGIWGGMFMTDPQTAMDMASGIGDSNLRTSTQSYQASYWLLKDPAAATQWIKSSALPQEVKTQLLQR
jgi:hypothetical protein